MTPDLELRRGNDARNVLESPVYQEAYAEIEQRLIGQMAVIEITKERAEYLRQLLVAHRKIRGYLEQVMMTGKMAEQSLTLMEKLRGKNPVF